MSLGASSVGAGVVSVFAGESTEESGWSAGLGPVSWVLPEVKSAVEDGAGSAGWSGEEGFSAAGAGDWRGDSVAWAEDPLLSGVLADVKELVPADGSSSGACCITGSGGALSA